MDIDHQLQLKKRLVMGIVNITPDSFSDGGEHYQSQQALSYIQGICNQGVDIIDIGAQSTFGPEAVISSEEEWTRLEPVLTQLDYSKQCVSLDTFRSTVMENALRLGVQMINDVTAMRADSDMIDVLLQYKPYYCLMYSADDTFYASRTNHRYDNVIETIFSFLQEKTNFLISLGYPSERIIVDPGLGFFISSDPQYSWEVINRLSELKSLGFKILIGPSMKSFLGGEMTTRKEKTLEASKKCWQNGADIVRVHQVAEHVLLRNQLKKSEVLV